MTKAEKRAFNWFFSSFGTATEEKKFAWVDEPFFSEAALLEGMGYLKFNRTETIKEEVDEDFNVNKKVKKKVYIITPKGFEMIYMSQL